MSRLERKKEGKSLYGQDQQGDIRRREEAKVNKQKNDKRNIYSAILPFVLKFSPPLGYNIFWVGHGVWCKNIIYPRR